MPSLSYWRLTLVLFTMGMVWMCTTTDVTDFSNEHESCVFVVIPVLFPISVAPLVNVPPFFFSLTVSLNFIHSKIHMVHTIISPLSGSITHGFAKHFPSQCIPSFHHRRKWSPGFSFFFFFRLTDDRVWKSHHLKFNASSCFLDIISRLSIKDCLICLSHCTIIMIQKDLYNSVTLSA